MLPKTHILLGLIFSFLLVYLFKISLFSASLVFLASVLIDFDHYLFHTKRNKNLNLKKAYYWHKSIPDNHKPILEIFHSVEFLSLILLLSFIWKPFIFILIGMIFHSILDIIDIYSKIHSLRAREFSLIKYLLAKDKSRYF